MLAARLKCSGGGGVAAAVAVQFEKHSPLPPDCLLTGFEPAPAPL